MSEHQQHPRWPLRFLEWVCPPPLLEGIEGDLVEQFYEDVDRHGLVAARRRFTIGVLRFCRHEILLRNSLTVKLINTIMVANYLKVAGRNISKRKLYSFINVFGLSIGMAFCMLIWLYIKDEKSFDQFHVNKDHIYRIEEHAYNYLTPGLKEEDRWVRQAYIQVPLAIAAAEEAPEVVLTTRFNTNGARVRQGEKVFNEDVTFVDKGFFQMFSFDLIAGNPKSVMMNKSDVIITPAMAEKYFGNEDPVGKTLLIDVNGDQPFTVSGIIEAPPPNSSFEFEMLISQENRRNYERRMQQWSSFNTPTFVMLHPGADLVQFSNNLQKIVDKHLSQLMSNARKEAKLPADAKVFEYLFTRLPDIHLDKEVSWHKSSDPQYSYILGGIAVLIMVIACINYIALALTTSAARRSEVGIRKVVGAQRKQLMFQFATESVVLAVGSSILGLLLMYAFLPWFNDFTGKGISLEASVSLTLVLFGIGGGLLVGIFAGSYPAFFLSGFSPVKVITSRFTGRVQTAFTKPLVVLQFALSAFLIISSVIMFRQMEYITNMDLGYDKEQVVVVSAPTYGSKIFQQMKRRLESEPEIAAVSGTSASFARGYSRNGYKIDGQNKSSYVYCVDPEYVNTLGIKLLMGRTFNFNDPADSNSVIVNEALVKDMNWSDPLSSYLNWKEDTVGLGAKVIGVVRDHHIRSLESAIDPMLLSLDKEAIGDFTSLLIKLRPGATSTGLDKIAGAWKELYPDLPYEYSFLDDDVAKQYESQARWLSIMGVSTVFAILISCMGLFGLAGINAVNRTKEIGIRKVMGAELSNIFVLLNRQYIWLSLIAFVLAIPFSWYTMNKWLSGFNEAFRIEMGPGIFSISILVGLGIALLTVSYHTIKAALTSPAETLKYE
jgi:putative ABC transport system permease protein